MGNRLLIAGLLCICAAGLADGQADESKAVTQMRTADPFKIESGSVFSASSPQKTSTVPVDFPYTQRGRIVADFAEALEVIKNNHVDARSIATETLSRSAISTMLRTLDPHSNYFDAREYREMLDEQRSEYSGIGSTIINYVSDGQAGTYIVATAPGSPASRAGLRYGDRIVAVDGEAMEGKPSDFVRDKVRGPGGTIVRLTIQHAATGTTSVVELKRARLYQGSLPDSYVIGNGVGYIDLTNGFNFTTAAELDDALKSLKRQGMTSLIIDLRGNPGGVLDQAVKVAEKFLPAGSLIVSQRGRFRIDGRVWRSTNKNPETMPLILLVDASSASASEVVAGALQDHDRALIVGERTFGKGLVQNVVDLPGGAGLTITTARYFTPSGRSIQRDYSSGSLYDYYNHKGGPTADELERFRAKTDSQRTVFGGDGISPDEMIKAERLSPLQLSLVDPLFHYSVKVSSSNIPNVDQLTAANIESALRTTSPAPGKEAVAGFIEFLQGDAPFAGKREALAAESDFIRKRLQYNFEMRSHGTAAAARVLIANDPQANAAIGLMPKAAQMAGASVRYRASK